MILKRPFAAMLRQQVVVTLDAFYARRDQLLALAANRALAAIYPLRWFPEVGGLTSYGPSPVALFHQAGTYTGKLLKGAKPTDLPVQQSTTFQRVINLAKTLNIGVPVTFLARADEVIE